MVHNIWATFTMSPNNLVSAIVISVCVFEISAFNLSPKPNIILKPNNKPLDRNTTFYFGLSLNLKRNSILVGAPEAIDKDNIKTGALYKCTFNDSECSTFTFNQNNVKMIHGYKLIKENQWLGASLDVSHRNNDQSLVCAPRALFESTDRYKTLGICYLTNTADPNDVKKIYLNPNQNDMNFAIQGMSVHITENDDYLMGAPGAHYFRGSVVKFTSDGIINEPKTFDKEINFKSHIRIRPHHVGFAISSGKFQRNKYSEHEMFYLTSAPNSNLAQGVVYIFGFPKSGPNMDIHHIFTGKQIGEYFGYSIIAEDFNNDGLTDVAIGAPFNTKTDDYDNGAVYIFKNKCNFIFDEPTILRTEYKDNGRFGTAMTKVGDINQDGFNDLVVAAPFEGNGVIYIYHGSKEGLLKQPSQRIEAPDSKANQMFGHGLSYHLGANKYTDIAVGAPNVDTVYIYKSYPVVSIFAEIKPFSKEMAANDTTLSFDFCIKYESAYHITFNVTVDAKIEADSRGRVTCGTECDLHDLQFNRQEMCTPVTLKFSDNSGDANPVEIKVTYKVKNGIPQNAKSNETQAYCDECVAVDPNKSKEVVNSIAIVTDCKENRCYPDLIITANTSDSQILGKTTTIKIDYVIHNKGDAAYLPQIHIELNSSEVKFLNFPSVCIVNTELVMDCELNNRERLPNEKNTTFSIGIDTSKLSETKLIVKANVFSTGTENKTDDNLIENTIQFDEFSHVIVRGNSSENIIQKNSDNAKENVTFTYEILNEGPSVIRSLDVFVYLPISFNGTNDEDIIDRHSILAENIVNGVDIALVNNGSDSLIANENITFFVPRSDETDRNSTFKCTGAAGILCHPAKFTLKNVNVGSIKISVNFTINLGNIPERDSFLIEAAIDLHKMTDENNSNVTMTVDIMSDPSTMVYTTSSVALIYVGFVLLAFILQLILIVVLSKCGFFRRKKREELVRLKRQSQMNSKTLSMIQPPSET